MKYLKRFLICLLVSIGLIFGLTFMMTLFNYFDLISSKVMNVFKLIIPLVSLMVGGFLLGKRAVKNGWLEGFKLSLVIIILILISNLVMDGFDFRDIIFYCLLLISSVLGSILGINKKEQ